MSPATGFFSVPLESLRTLLANTEAFQEFVGAANVTEALEKAFVWYTPVEGSMHSALASITWKNGDWSATREANNSGQANFDFNTALTIIFEKKYDEVTAANQMDFMNQLGAIINDMMGLSEPSAGYVLIKEYDLNSFVVLEGTNFIFQAEYRIGLER